MNNIAKSKILMATGETGMIRGDVREQSYQYSCSSASMRKKVNWLYSTVSTIINSETVENI